MNIKILIDGKLRDKYFKDGVLEYKKRITPYSSIEIIETDKFVDYCSKPSSYVITLEIEGRMLDSIEFANKLREIQCEGYNELLFLIGGSDGLSDEARALSNFKFSMSKLTFLHQEAILILIEQIYRAFKILNNETYHK